MVTLQPYDSARAYFDSINEVSTNSMTTLTSNIEFDVQHRMRIVKATYLGLELAPYNIAAGVGSSILISSETLHSLPVALQVERLE